MTAPLAFEAQAVYGAPTGHGVVNPQLTKVLLTPRTRSVAARLRAPRTRSVVFLVAVEKKSAPDSMS
ncbi:MAG: hypothetical protein ACJ79B_11955, partial [Gemmatimonadaceae bacterium]